jgi:hypothetical protein
MTSHRGAGTDNGTACHEYARAGELPVVNFLQSRAVSEWLDTPRSTDGDSAMIGPPHLLQVHDGSSSGQL